MAPARPIPESRAADIPAAGLRMAADRLCAYCSCYQAGHCLRPRIAPGGPLCLISGPRRPPSAARAASPMRGPAWPNTVGGKIQFLPAGRSARGSILVSPVWVTVHFEPEMALIRIWKRSGSLVAACVGTVY
jgi:hypothetical protein